jgi:hypothetical protein
MRGVVDRRSQCHAMGCGAILWGRRPGDGLDGEDGVGHEKKFAFARYVCDGVLRQVDVVAALLAPRVGAPGARTARTRT